MLLADPSLITVIYYIYSVTLEVPNKRGLLICKLPVQISRIVQNILFENFSKNRKVSELFSPKLSEILKNVVQKLNVRK